MLSTTGVSLLRRMRSQKTGETKSVSSRDVIHYLLPAIALLGGLTGCHRKVPGEDVDIDAPAYKYMHAADVTPMKEATPGVGSVIDMTTGKPFASSPAASPMQLPTPTAVSSDVVLDDPNGTIPEGEKEGSWVGTLDIYWKLNWIRQELMAGNVPRVLPDVVARQRRHLLRIMHESKHLDPDPGHYIPDGVTIPETLAYADRALKRLSAGLEHLQENNRLESVGIRPLGVAWSATEDDVMRQFEQQGVVRTARVATRSEQDEDSFSSITISKRPRNSGALSTTQQEEAVQTALKYVRQYHASPMEMARREFEGALREIVQMRDLLHYEFHKPSVPGNSTMVPSLLHQEPGSLPPSATPSSVKDMTDPFRESREGGQSVLDPFRESADTHSER